MTRRSALALIGIATTLCALASAPPADAGDKKSIGKRYRIKVVSAGVPVLGGVLSGYRCRTKYVITQGDKFIGKAYLGDYVYLDEPGKFTVSVNGTSREVEFELPREITRDRLWASWKRDRAVELRPKGSGGRLSVPSLWVMHPILAAGNQNCDYAISGREKTKGKAKGVAVIYPPEDIRDIDDGVLFSNTLVHLFPGDYSLEINGAEVNFSLEEDETRLMQLAALKITGRRPENVELLQTRGKIVRKVTVREDDDWTLCPPGRYRFGAQTLTVAAGRVRSIEYRLPGLKTPRLGIRAETAFDAKGTRVGVRVKGFVANSPAAEAGLKAGDIIVAVEGNTVVDNRSLGRELVQRKIGDAVDFQVRREGRAKALTVTVTLGLLKASGDNPAKPAPKKSKPKSDSKPKKKKKRLL